MSSNPSPIHLQSNSRMGRLIFFSVTRKKTRKYWCRRSCRSLDCDGVSENIYLFINTGHWVHLNSEYLLYIIDNVLLSARTLRLVHIVSELA